jgi:hypothetical protein
VPPSAAVVQSGCGPAPTGHGRGGPLPPARHQGSLSDPSAIPEIRRSRRHEAQLQLGFAWDALSLAMLYRWRTKSKKGSEAIARKGVFPGHDKASLDAAWAQHKTAARRYYEESNDDEDSD